MGGGQLWALFVLALSSTACGSSSDDSAGKPSPKPGEFEAYFDGQTLDGFEFVGVPATDMTIENGELHCNCLPNGYFYKNEVYRNFVMELEFRFERPVDLAPGDDATFVGNSGVFVYLAPPHGVWPVCLEVQGSYQETGDIFRLPGLLPGNDNPDLTALGSVRKPVGEWNQMSIKSDEGTLEVQLNGVLVNQSAAGDLKEGIVALESEGAETHWRNVRIQRWP